LKKKREARRKCRHQNQKKKKRDEEETSEGASPMKPRVKVFLLGFGAGREYIL